MSDTTTTLGLRILLAESHGLALPSPIQELTLHGHRIDQARTPAEIQAALEREAYDVVLQDLMRPVINPSDFKQLADKVPYRAAPALMTVGDQPPDGTAPANWHEAARQLSSMQREAGTTSAPAAPPYELSEALLSTDGDVELLQSLIELYFEQQETLLTGIEKGMAERNAELVERNAHSLKGAIGVFGAAAARKAAFDLEMAGRDQKWEEASPAWSKLKEALGIFDPALKQLNDRILAGENVAP